MCVTVMLLLTAAHSKRACDYTAIISTYRALILVELQSLNLTGALDISKEKDHCPSEKVHRILRYIYSMTQIFSCLSERQRQHADHMTKVVGQMEQLITRNCRKPERLASRRKKSILQSREEGKRKTAAENENDGDAYKLLAEAAECDRLLNYSIHRSQFSSTTLYLKQYAQ